MQLHFLLFVVMFGSNLCSFWAASALQCGLLKARASQKFHTRSQYMGCWTWYEKSCAVLVSLFPFNVNYNINTHRTQTLIHLTCKKNIWQSIRNTSSSCVAMLNLLDNTVFPPLNFPLHIPTLFHLIQLPHNGMRPVMWLAESMTINPNLYSTLSEPWRIRCCTYINENSNSACTDLAHLYLVLCVLQVCVHGKLI